MGSATWGPPREIVHGLSALCGPRVFVETGTFLGETAAWAACHFDQVYSIEAAVNFHREASQRHARLRNIRFLHGESQTLLPRVIAQLDQPALFWLDAHWSGGATWGKDNECPLLDELATINDSPFDHVVLIDDARLFLAPPPSPHRAEQWPDIGRISSLLAKGGRRLAVLEDVIVGVPERHGPLFAAFLQHYLRRHPTAMSSPTPAAWTFARMDLAWQFRRHEIKPRAVLHIGAHLGQELPLYLKMGFERALLVEANPALLPDLEKRVRQALKDSPTHRGCQVELAHYAITDRNGHIELRVNANSESSSVLALKQHLEHFPQMVEVERVRVPSRTLDSLLDGMGSAGESFNFLNIDVQGAELLVLSGGSKTLSHIDAICSEINFSELYEGCALAWQLDDFLKQHGFARVATHHPHKTAWGDAFYVKTPKVSAIVSIYDAADLIVERLENLLAQTLFQRGLLEIIIVDSASPGNEWELIQPYLARYPDRIRYLRTPKRETIYAAWNRAIEIARGEYLTSQNVDDRMKPDALARLAAYLDTHPECVLAHADQEIVRRGMPCNVDKLSRKHWNWGPFIRSALLFNTQVGSQPMWRTRAHYLAGYFDPTFSALGDREFYLRLSQHGEFHYIPEVFGSLDHAEVSLSRGNKVASREGRLILERYLGSQQLAQLLGYPPPDANNQAINQILHNNLCCQLAEEFAASGLVWTVRLLENLRVILAAVQDIAPHAATVAANLAKIAACRTDDNTVDQHLASSLRLVRIPYPGAAGERSQAQRKPFRLEQKAPTNLDSPLLAYARNVRSQTGEDGILERVFSLLPETTRYFIEFGAWDGQHLSNCWNLAVNHGWSGCFIEAEETRFAALLDHHGSNGKIRCLNRFVELSGPNSLDNILDSLKAPTAPALLSIDIDGMDYFVWESLQRYQPSVVIIEFNPTVPNDVLFVQPKDASVNQGCSLLALVELAHIKGYELACCTDFNAIFVHEALYPLLNITDNSIERLYRPLMDGRIFHGYDSHIYVTGMPRLGWSESPIGNEDFQVLPKSKRKFEDRRQGPGTDPAV